ncbi:MAG: hypothetical protein ABIR57_13800 [Aeromicrobium sp.]
MKRVSVALVVAMMAAGTLSGCGGSAYCDDIKGGQKTLNSFGQTRTNKAYQGYADLLRKIAKDAPKDVQKDWTKLASRTEGVLAAQKSVGLKLEDMTNTKKVAALKKADLAKLNDAYTSFNGTTKERASVVKNVKQECKITLK